MPISKKIITALFQLTTEESWLSNKDAAPVFVNLDRIAYDEWEPTRTANCLEAMKDNFPLHPVRLVCFNFNDKQYFDVSDGNHRCKARELTGHTDVSANVEGFYNVTTDDKFLHDHMIWQKSGPEFQCLSVDYLDDWLIEELKGLGINEYNNQ